MNISFIGNFLYDVTEAAEEEAAAQLPDVLDVEGVGAVQAFVVLLLFAVL